MRLLPLVLAALCASILPASASGERDADELIESARRAGSEKKQPVLVRFGASWSVWCRQFEAFLKDPVAGKIMDRYFVAVAVVIQEHGENKHSEHRHGLEALKRYGGENAGLPFYVFLDPATGAVIVDCRGPKNAGEMVNVGFPANADEIERFLIILRHAAPKITETELQTLATRLRELGQP